MSEEVEVYEEVEELDEDLFHDESKLMRIAGWANAVAWIILVIAAIFSLTVVFFQIRQGALQAGVNGILGILSNLFVLLVGGFFFILLEAIGEGIYLFMDIEEHLRH
ncbi:MAG: hypothetical protein ACPL1K_06930 [Candidatus Kryptoniota bacterium]